MDLFFPQWQGSGATDEVYHGARLLRDHLSPPISFVDVPVQPLHPLTLEQNIWGRAVLIEQLSAARAILQQHDPSHIFSVGGDCAGEIASVSFLNAKYQGDLAVVWMDAHADMNTPASSPSKTLHGMPLRTLLGEGDASLLERAFSTLSPRQVFLVGTREFDPDEEHYIQQHQVSVLNDPQAFQGLADQITSAGFRQVYIHLDFDVLDPGIFPYTTAPSANGLSINRLMAILEALHRAFEVVGFSLLELAAAEPSSLTVIQPILDFYAHRDVY